ncbi:hypothetical protein C8Q78DRAFT_1073917 [Trametes maxima]|nr:hypothetical protein C8Q78DRAFT_1073917 [Trametes maxima]
MTSIGNVSVSWGRLVKLGRLLGDPGPLPRVVLALSLAATSVLWHDPLANAEYVLPNLGLPTFEFSLSPSVQYGSLVAFLPLLCLIAWYLFSFVVAIATGSSPVTWITRHIKSCARRVIEGLLTGTGYCDPVVAEHIQALSAALRARQKDVVETKAQLQARSIHAAKLGGELTTARLRQGVSRMKARDLRSRLEQLEDKCAALVNTTEDLKYRLDTTLSFDFEKDLALQNVKAAFSKSQVSLAASRRLVASKNTTIKGLEKKYKDKVDESETFRVQMIDTHQSLVADHYKRCEETVEEKQFELLTKTQLHSEEAGRVINRNTELEAELTAIKHAKAHQDFMLQTLFTQVTEYRAEFDRQEWDRYEKELKRYDRAQRRGGRPANVKKPEPPALAPPPIKAVEAPVILVTAPSSQWLPRHVVEYYDDEKLYDAATTRELFELDTGEPLPLPSEVPEPEESPNEVLAGRRRTFHKVRTAPAPLDQEYKEEDEEEEGEEEPQSPPKRTASRPAPVVTPTRTSILRSQAVRASSPSPDTSATGVVRSPTHSRRGLGSPSKTAWI